MDEQILRNEWGRHTIEEVARLLRRSYRATATKASRLGLKKDHYGIVWTDEQLKLLRAYFPIMFNRPLAKQIGVSMRTLIRNCSGAWTGEKAWIPRGKKAGHSAFGRRCSPVFRP